MSPKAVLVTGTSAGGIGSALALAFHRRGFHVFAALRTPSKAAQLAALPNVTVLTLDVTCPSSIAAAVQTVDAKTEGRGLDVLVNNSGVGYTMPLVDASPEDGRRLFDVNFWGTLAMIQAFAPQIIKTAGAILNISSVGGEVHTPWLGLYSASKAATTCLSETLRLELAPFGVTVLTAMVGTVGSNFFENAPEHMLPAGSIYEPIRRQIVECARGKGNPKQMDVDVFAARMVGDVLGGKKGRVWRGSKASTVKWAVKLVPGFILGRLLSGGRGLDVLVAWIQTHGVVKKR